LALDRGRQRETVGPGSVGKRTSAGPVSFQVRIRSRFDRQGRSVRGDKLVLWENINVQLAFKVENELSTLPPTRPGGELPLRDVA
jgi:hypothetical protein